MTYNEKYFETGNYIDYHERAPRYYKLAKEIIQLLENLNLIKDNSSFLDYGCATGHLIGGIIRAGYKNVCGMDISDYAISECQKAGYTVFDANNDEVYIPVDVMTALDVFEHMTDDEILHIFKSKKVEANVLIVRIPVKIPPDNDFYLDISRKDKTHINCKSKYEWISFFRNLGYSTHFELNLSTIYTSPGVISLLIL